MADQWYLDLDGTRSGPYPTNEVLSLIEEGEVLPHHRISRGLRNPDWITILDWRFEQAKAALQPKAASPGGPKVKLNLSSKMAPVAPPEPKVNVPQSSPETSPSPTRDPMAEMFDLLQNSKNKRESKQAHAHAHGHGQAHPHAPGPAETATSSNDRGSFGKLIAICVVVAIVGLALGQFFQGRLKSPSSSNTPSSPASSPPPKTEADAEIVDRSNDKMTIKSVVEKRAEPTPYRPPAPARTPYIAPTPVHREELPDDKKPVDKELEELRDLKKELQELKSLKEQLKENPSSEEFPQPDGSAQPLDGEAPAGGAPSGIAPE
jgi:hypothetical protein